MTFTSGDRIGQYEIVAVIGTGGMGEVYRARDTRLGRDVAIKTLHVTVAGDPARLARLEREARALAALNHPNIATVHGLEDFADGGVLVMELVEGHTLEQIIRSAPAGGGIPLDEALVLARQLADGLDAAHERGIIHRDLKPANIKVTPAGVVKILDFGLAKASDDHGVSGEAAGAASTMTRTDTLEGTVLGTLAYMSPEQARGQALDKRTDIWAFGCVLFEMITGRPAFARATASDTVSAVLMAAPELAALPPGVPAGVRRLIARCLEKDPKQRLRDIGEMRHIIDQPQTETAPAAGISRRTLLTAGGTALGLMAAGFAGGLFARPGRRLVPPAFQRLTYRRGMIRTARFGPDYRTVYYGALWDGDDCRVYAVRADSPESSPLPLPPATPLAVSSTGVVALSLGTHRRGIMTYGTLAQVPLAGGAPRKLLEGVKFADWSPDGNELAVVRQVDGQERLEFPIGTVVAEPTVAGGGFGFPRVSPRGDAVAAFELPSATWLQGRVIVVNRSGSRLSVSPDYFNVFGLAWHGTEVWFTAADELPLFRNAVNALTPDGAVREVARVPGNASLHDSAPDGRVLIARTDDRGGISVLAPGDAFERDLSWLDAPTLADISRDGRHILFSESGVGGGPKGSTYLRSTDGSPAVRLGDGGALALSPDASRAIVTLEGGEAAEVIPTGAGQSRRLGPPGLLILQASWLPDGRRVVVMAAERGQPPQLLVLDADGGPVVPLTPAGAAVSSRWSLSPDGSAVGLSTSEGIAIQPVETSGARRMVPGTTRADHVIGWIDAGLLVSSNPLTDETVYRVDPATGGRKMWKAFTLRDPTGTMSMDLGSLVVTPDGRSYGYGWHRAISDLYLVEGWT